MLIFLGGCAGLMALAPLVLAVLIAFFYVEEDWRGAHAWAQAKADIEAKGETLDPEKFIPAPVPDAENFGALPYFKVVTGPGGLTGRGWQRFSICDTLKNVTDKMAMSSDTSSAEDTLPYLGNWQKGEPPDSYRFTERMGAFLKRQQPQAIVPGNATPFEIFEMICPALVDLRSAAQSHTECVFQEEINYGDPEKQTFGANTSLISLIKIFMYDGRLAMLANHPEIAIQDLRVGWRSASGVQKEPYSVANLVASGLIAIQLRLIQQGLSSHAWNEEQLGELEGDMEKLDYLAQSRRQLNGEAACYSVPMIDYYAAHRSRWAKDIDLLRSMFEDQDAWQARAFKATYLFIPNGWFDLAKADEIGRKIEKLRRIDLPSRQVHPGPEPEKSSDPAIWWLDFVLPDLNLTKDLVAHVAYTQVQLDEACIACRLERYWLAHHSYPMTLDDLANGYGPLPHDLMNGEAYHYRLNPDQTYILYSVGWNQVDDHGDAGNVRTWESPDWIWTNYPTLK